MEQAISELAEDAFNDTVFLQAYDTRRYDILDILDVMDTLYEEGKRIFFLDEVTFAENFPAGCMRIADDFARGGCRVCVTGTHSLSIWLAKNMYMQGRYEEVKTTVIPFAEWSRLLFPGELPDSDEYLRRGGVLDLYGISTRTALACASSPDDISTRAGASFYIHSAVALNIQNSIAKHKRGELFGDLQALYDEGALTDAIARIVQHQGHQATLSVLNGAFASDDAYAIRLGTCRTALSKSLSGLWQEVEKRIAREIGIDNERRRITAREAKAIIEWLKDIDFFEDAPDVVLSIDGSSYSSPRTILAQPALRTEQMLQAAGTFLTFLREEGLEYDERRIEKLIENAVFGHMQEDVVLSELKRSLPGTQIFGLKLKDGNRQIAEYDVAVAAPNGVALLEIKHSDTYRTNHSEYTAGRNKVANSLAAKSLCPNRIHLEESLFF